MAFEYGCFVSYPHDDGELINTFMGDLVTALESELGAYLERGRKVYIDRNGLNGGRAHATELARAMCASACWILVYSPKYRRRPWCRSEFRAMRLLEQQRRQALGRDLPPTKSMIIPVLLRGDMQDLPSGIPDSRFVVDFSAFMVGQQRIIEHPGFNVAIRRLSTEIFSIYQLWEGSDEHPRDCETFELPEPDEADWNTEVGGLSQGRPF